MAFDMIISFTVRNYKSIKEETTLHFGVDNIDGVHTDNIAYPDKDGKIPVLRSAGIWGPNASGKSNLLNALDALQDFVATSHKYELDQPIDEYNPFKLDASSAVTPVFFELEFIGRDKLRYVYSVEFNRHKVIIETLHFYPGAKPAKLFERKPDTEQSTWFGTRLSGAKAMPCLENRAYLSVAAHNENSSEQLKNVFRYIRDDINIINPMSMFSTKLLKQAHYSQSLAALLACVDTGIQEIKLKEENVDVKLLPENMPDEMKQHFLQRFKYQPMFKHNDSLEWFSMDDESDGTKRIYDLAPMILIGVARSDVWVLDELDCQLHPKIVELIIRLFHDPTVNRKNSQLIFTGHNTVLMSSDLFRRDQIWFTQKDGHGATELTGLDEYNQVRADTNFEKWYRDGRFDAIPEVNYSELKQCITQMAELISFESSDNE